MSEIKLIREQLEALIAGRRFTEDQLNAIRSSILRGEIDTIAHAASGGVALAVEILKAYEQEEARRSS